MLTALICGGFPVLNGPYPQMLAMSKALEAASDQALQTSKRNLFMTIEWEARQQAGQRSVAKQVCKHWGISRRYLEDVRREHSDEARTWLQRWTDTAAVLDLCDQVREAIPRQRAG